MDKIARLTQYSKGLGRVLESIPQAVLIIDPKLRILYANPSAYGLFNAADETLIGARLSTVIAPVAQQEVRRTVQKVLIPAADEHSPSLTFLTTARKLDGAPLFARLTATQLVADAGAVSAILRFDVTPDQLFSDLTPRQQELTSLAATLSEVFDQFEDPVFVLDQQWRYQFINPAAEAVLRRQRKTHVIGKVIWEVLPEVVGSEFYLAALKAVQTQKVTELEDYYPSFGLWFRTKLYPTSHGLVGHAQDITETIETRNLNKQLTGSLEQAMSVYWRDDNRKRRESQSKK